MIHRLNKNVILGDERSASGSSLEGLHPMVDTLCIESKSTFINLRVENEKELSIQSPYDRDES